MSKQKILLISLLVLVLGLSACQSTGWFNPLGQERNNAITDYFVGTEGVNMRFSDPTAPPPIIYYDSSAERDDNAFLVSIDVQNVGSSWTRGGIYVSGYDPYMIRFADIDIPRLNAGWSDCIIDINVLNEQWGGGIQCSTVGVGLNYQDPNNWNARINSLGNLFESFGWEIENEMLDNFIDGVQISAGSTAGVNQLDLNFDLTQMDFFNRGYGLLFFINGLSFDRFNGKEFVLHPDDYNFPGGELTVIPFEGEVRNWPQGLDRTERPVNFLVTSCYLYTTYAAPQVCIDPAPFDLNSRKVCQPREITFNGGNGAPIAVTSIEQENTPRQVFFTINIANVDNGRVFDLGYLERCSPYYPGRLNQNQLDKVYIIDARIGSQPLFCTPDRADGVRLINGRGQFRCRYDMEYATARSAYETPLVLELGYGYSQNIQRSVMVKRII